MERLKSCPFCGGRARLEQTSFGTIDENSSVRLGFKLKCAKCGASSPKAIGYIALNLDYEGNLNPWHDDRPEAIEDWNRRDG